MPEVRIPGVGLVHFPYDMPPDQIAAAAKRLHDEALGSEAEPPLTLERRAPSSDEPGEGMWDMAVRTLSNASALPPGAAPLLRRDNLSTTGGVVGGLAAGPAGAGLGSAAGSALSSVIGQAESGQAPTFEELVGGIGKAATSGVTAAATDFGAGKLVKGAGAVGRALYGKALAPSKALTREFPDLVETAIREGFNVTPKGATRAGAARQASAADARDLVSSSAAAHSGVRVTPRSLTKGLDPLRAKVAKQPEANVAGRQIDTFEANLLASHPQAKTLEELLDLKQGAQGEARAAYKASQVGNRSAGVEAEANKAIAQRAREILESFVPESGAANTRTQSLMGIERAIGDATTRPHMGRFLGSAGIGGLGAVANPVAGLPAAAATYLATSPRTLGRAGIMLGRAGQNPILNRTAGPASNALRAALLEALEEDEPAIGESQP